MQQRLKRLQQELVRAQIDACLIEHPLNLFYLTGLNLTAGKFLVHPDGVLLLVDGRYLQLAYQSSFPVSSDTSEAWSAFLKKHHICRLGFDGRQTSYDRHRQLERENNLLKLVSCSDLLQKLRLIKDNFEILQMKKSALLLWQGFEFIRSLLKVGVSEKELARDFEIFCLENGAERLSFEPIIAFGASSAMPHYRAQDVVLKSGDVVLIDIGVVYGQYHSDMTRTLFFQDAHPYLHKLYTIAQKAQQSALALCRPGQSIGDLDAAARKIFKEEGVESLFLHSLGHGIGLEVHEFPKIRYDGDDRDVLLKKGMVFTLEPGLYCNGVGGVRYEDTILITESGYENFYPILGP